MRRGSTAVLSQREDQLLVNGIHVIPPDLPCLMHTLYL
jgi:hypothetical protein